MTGRVGHGTGRVLDVPTCGQSPCATHDARARQLPDGTMTGGTQPTYIRGIDRRKKVPSTRHLEPPETRAREPGSRVVLDRSIHIRDRWRDRRRDRRPDRRQLPELPGAPRSPRSARSPGSCPRPGRDSRRLGRLRVARCR